MNTIITQREYTNEVESIAEAVYQEVRDYGGELHELASQAVDGHQWIIYTAYHAEILDCATNLDAYHDVYSDADIGRLVAESGISAAIQAQAFFAFEQDVNAALYELAEKYKFTAWVDGVWA